MYAKVPRTAGGVTAWVLGISQFGFRITIHSA
jgi:hypothetical protein